MNTQQTSNILTAHHAHASTANAVSEYNVLVPMKQTVCGDQKPCGPGSMEAVSDCKTYRYSTPPAPVFTAFLRIEAIASED